MGQISLRCMFGNSLSKQIKDQLATRDEPWNLDELVNPALCINNHLCERRTEKVYSSQLHLTYGIFLELKTHCLHAFSTEPEPEPMQVEHTHLTLEEM